MADVEYIAAAAVRLGDATFSIPRPGRHDAVIRALLAFVGEDAWSKHPARKVLTRLQGFLTSRGRFVTREEAVDIAFAAGQIAKRYSMLTTECIENWAMAES